MKNSILINSLLSLQNTSGVIPEDYILKALKDLGLINECNCESGEVCYELTESANDLLDLVSDDVKRKFQIDFLKDLYGYSDREAFLIYERIKSGLSHHEMEYASSKDKE